MDKGLRIRMLYLVLIVSTFLGIGFILMPNLYTPSIWKHIGSLFVIALLSLLLIIEIKKNETKK